MTRTLKYKSFVYRYTGVYLANREEKDYIKSEVFWDKFRKIIFSPENGMSDRSIQKFLVGIWQSEHGLARPMLPFGWRRRRLWYWKPVIAITTFFLAAKTDLMALVYRRL
jgi:hypothetical protein